MITHCKHMMPITNTECLKCQREAACIASDNEHITQTFHSLPSSGIKLMVMGHARHGKDTVCEILRDEYGLSFKSSSEMACELFIYSTLRDSHGYQTIEECFNDRTNQRETWFQLISNYCHENQNGLTRAIFSGHNIYCGIRNREEFDAAKDAELFDLAIWVDASHRHPPESTDSCTVTRDDADYLIDNNGSLDELKRNIHLMMKQLPVLLDLKN